MAITVSLRKALMPRRLGGHDDRSVDVIELVGCYIDNQSVAFYPGMRMTISPT
jgi:hypothetical protein